MTTQNHLYDPNQSVWVVTDKCGLVKGTVSRLSIHVDVTVLIQYVILTTPSEGELVYDEADVFADKATALSEYDIRLGI